MHVIYPYKIECELAHLRNQVQMNYHIDVRIDRKFIINYLEKIDECLYNKDYENCKKYLYDLYNWINVGHLFHELNDYDENQHLYMDARKIPKVESIPQKNGNKGRFPRRCK